MKIVLTQLELLKNSTKQVDKIEVLKQNEDNALFKRIINYLVDDFQLVGISTKKMSKHVEPTENNYTLEELLEYLLANPTGTDVQLSVIQGFLDNHNDNREQLEQIITKKFTIGLSAKTVNKVYGKGFAPTFDVQLAFPSEKKIDKYSDTDKFVVTQKLDGFRALTIIQNDAITTHTRNGLVIDGLSELHAHIKVFIDQNKDLLSTFENGLVIDGELLAANTNNLNTNSLFNLTAKTIQTDKEKTNLEYHLFDILGYDEFQNGETKAVYGFRRRLLNELKQTPLVRIVPALALITKADIPQWSLIAQEKEWEGVMLNSVYGKYKTTRSADLLKVKKMKTADLEVIDVIQAIDGKYKGELQAIVVRLDENNTLKIGSGLTDELRKEIWTNQDKYIGKVVEVSYFEETTNKDGGRSLRFPVFKGFRFDKTPDDTNIE